MQVRFHFTGNFGWWWELDNVFIGTRTCAPTPGGLVAGIVTDNNTGPRVNGATVASNADSRPVTATSAATPDDPNLSDGFYWLFSPLTGQHPFTATGRTTPGATATVNVAADSPPRPTSTSRPARSRSPRPRSTRRSPGRSRRPRLSPSRTPARPGHSQPR